MKRTVAPTLQWVETAPSSADPVEDVDSGNTDYAISDAREFSFAHHLYPNVLVGFALPEERPAQWLVRRGGPDLLASVNAFFRELDVSGTLARLVQQSSGDTRRFAYGESREFQAHVGDRLPRYRSWFEQAAAQAGIDWRLLAAIGYQESKWDPHAESDDGAAGVMMLTAETAHSLGVKDRSNPQQSIFGGARYLAQVRAMFPERISEPDRTWLIVAAYNVGFGHLEDARVITQALGKNPDSWTEVRARLPLLAQERWYSRARRGYARGWEPVQYVDRIHAMVESGQREHVGDAAGATGARIEGTEHEPPHARVHDRRGAHHARLERHVECGVGEAIAAERAGAGAQRLDLGVCGRIASRDRLICARGDDVLAPHQHRAHRHLAGRAGRHRLGERRPHEDAVAPALRSDHATRRRAARGAGETAPDRRRSRSAPRRSADGDPWHVPSSRPCR